MGLFAAGKVVVLPYPYSDLTGAKLRPVLLLADAGRGDWIGSQITSNPFADARAVSLSQNEFSTGGLDHLSYLRPGKLFTASESLIVKSLGSVTPAVLRLVRDSVIQIIGT
jgi:mRNA interferase MazF